MIREANVKRVIGTALLLTAVLGLCLGALSLRAWAEKPAQLKPRGYVNDFAGVIDPSAKQKLTALCEEVNRKAGAQMAIVTIHTTAGVPVDEFSIDLAQRWGIGPKKTDRGVMILLVVNDHRYRIEVGYGLEGILPDGKVGRIGREAVPLLRAGNYSGALLLMAGRVAGTIAAARGVKLTSAVLPPPEPSGPMAGIPIGTILFLLFFFGLPMLGWLLPLILGGALGNPRRRGAVYRRPWIMGGYWPGTWTGGGFGGGGRGWGGGGGFGGFGGGSFGGGGATGSW